MDQPQFPPTPHDNAPSDWTYARARQLEGTLEDDPSTGIWQNTHFRLLRGWGCLGLAKSSGAEFAWPAADPSTADEIAKKHRIDLYYRVWHYSDVLKAEVRKNGVSACFRVTDQWESTPEGRLDFDQTGQPILGGHSLAVGHPLFFMPRPAKWVGDDYFTGHNSWGSGWGNRGWFAMTYEFFNREVYEAWAMSIHDEMPPLYGQGIQRIQWTPEGDLERKFYVFDIYDADKDDRLAWSIVVFRRGELHLEELYVKPEHRGLGYGREMLTEFINLSARMGPPLRTWIPFSDVASDESLERLQRFFLNAGLGFEPSPNRSAAFCAVPGGSREIPPFDLPPKASYIFPSLKKPALDLGGLSEQFNVSNDFIKEIEDIFQAHDETLRRLA